MHPHEKHNALVAEFVRKVGAASENSGELMVLIESVIVAGILLNTHAYGVKPATACALVEVAVQRATERFTEQVNSNG
jgi:hypothetical protein